MTLNSFTNQTIALAGISQAAHLVQEIATTGTADQEAMEASIGSILKIDSDSVAEIYGGLTGIKTGLEQLQFQLANTKIHNPEQARYAASLVFLEKQLTNNQQMLSTIRTGIEKAKSQTEHFPVLHENVLANLGDLYHNTISTLQPRIMVQGEQRYITNPSNINKIRTLLLAGIRSAILWRQCGGRRWKFLIYRKKLRDECNFLLENTES
jgi:high frequency lysogenization protein